MDINKGDLVDFGAYGKLYVCNPNFSEDYFWVTDEESERDNEYASGWSISKDLADAVIESYEDLDEEFTFGINNNIEESLDDDLEYLDYCYYDDQFTDEELANIYDDDRNYCPECGSDRYHDGHCYNCSDAEDISESVTPEYFSINFENIYSKYLSDFDEKMAEQAVSATLRLINGWYNDGDVYDNTKYLTGGVTDISSYANWLYNYIEETQNTLDEIENTYSHGEYEDLLQQLAKIVFDEELLLELSQKEAISDIADEDGKFNFVMSEPVDVSEVDEDISFDNCDVDFDIFSDDLEEDTIYTESKNSIKADELKSEIENEIIKVMTGPKFGFEESEVFDYTVIEVVEEKEYIKVEVRAELSYNGMTKLGDALDKIIQKYNDEAYFDQEEPGIMSAYLYN